MMGWLLIILAENTLSAADMIARMAAALSRYNRTSADRQAQPAASGERSSVPAGASPRGAWRLILCFRMADGLNTTTRRAEILAATPVLGLRPTRWLFLRTVKEPNEDN